MSTELYQKAGAQYKEAHKGHAEESGEEAEAANPHSHRKDDNVVDADYEVKDEDEKKKKK